MSKKDLTKIYLALLLISLTISGIIFYLIFVAGAE